MQSSHHLKNYLRVLVFTSSQRFPNQFEIYIHSFQVHHVAMEPCRHGSHGDEKNKDDYSSEETMDSLEWKN